MYLVVQSQTPNKVNHPGSFAIRTETKIDFGEHNVSKLSFFKKFDEEADHVITIGHHKTQSIYNKCSEFEQTDFGKEMAKRLN